MTFTTALTAAAVRYTYTVYMYLVPFVANRSVKSFCIYMVLNRLSCMHKLDIHGISTLSGGEMGGGGGGGEDNFKSRGAEPPHNLKTPYLLLLWLCSDSSLKIAIREPKKIPHNFLGSTP